MKKIAAIAASIALAGGVAIGTAAPAQAGPKEDRLFVQLVTKEAPELRGISIKTMVKTAKSTCKFLRAGFGAVDAVTMMEDNGFSQKAAVAFVAGSVVFYCPEQEGNY